MKLCVLLGVLLVLLPGPLGAGEDLNVRVSPEVSYEPANLMIRAVVERRAENRFLEVIAESDDFYRSSEVQLNGDSAPRITVFAFRQVPAGAYQVRGTLIGADGRVRASVRRRSA